MLRAIAGLGPHLRDASAAGRRERGEHAAVRRGRRHLQDRWDQPVSLRELAGVAGLSRFELLRRFAQQNSLTPHAFQRDLRVQRARAMLADGAPVATVAAACGVRRPTAPVAGVQAAGGREPGGVCASGKGWVRRGRPAVAADILTSHVARPGCVGGALQIGTYVDWSRRAAAKRRA
ncbi:MAG: helix-turn-helix domain-containing protein, partial [Solirubrobacteraceae bacterium]